MTNRKGFISGLTITGDVEPTLPFNVEIWTVSPEKNTAFMDTPNGIRLTRINTNAALLENTIFFCIKSIVAYKTRANNAFYNSDFSNGCPRLVYW